MKEAHHPEQHVFEEPTNDFFDVVYGFLGMFTFMFVVAIVVTIIKIYV